MYILSNLKDRVKMLITLQLKYPSKNKWNICIFYFIVLFSPSYLIANNNPVMRLNLEESIRIAASNHFAIQAINNRKAAIDKLITERWREYLPGVGINYNRSADVTEKGRDNINHNLRLTIEEVIYDGGRRGIDLDLARLDAILAHEDFIITYNRLRLDVEKSYFRVLAARGKVDLNKKSLERALIQVRLAKKERDLGVGTQLQVMSVASRAQEIELAYRKSLNEVKQSMHDFKQALYLDYTANIELEGDIFKDFILKKPVVEIDTLIARARSSRPEIKRTQAEMKRKEGELKLAENAWIPRVSVGYYIGRSGEYFPLLKQDWGVTLKVTLPLTTSTNTSTFDNGQKNDGITTSNQSGNQLQLFNNMSYGRRILEAKTSFAESVNQYKILNQSVAIDVSKNKDNLLEAWDSIRIGNGRVFSQFEAVRIMTSRYQVGEARRADIVFAENELVKAQTDLTDALAKYLTAVYEIEFISGIEPGTLKLFHYAPGKGNTLLSVILTHNLIRPLRKRELDPEELFIDNIGKESQDEQPSLIDSININEK